ncbi:uncharacterized protein BcabD6B2_15650 [Babesia caballi]|uniref:Vesicle transport protein n=1 Tax=Babesia caballi TaxID=5871 RepID=A0AAV4LRI0_BABCB|nr:integral membrane protein [Babesia caballi]
MAGPPLPNSNGSTRASDFLNFEAPKYGQFGAHASGAGKSQGFNSSAATGFGSSDAAQSAMPTTLPGSSAFGGAKEDNYLLKGFDFIKKKASNIQGGFGDSTRSNSVVGGNAGLFGNDTASTARSSFSTIMSAGRSVLGLSGGNDENQSWMTYTNYTAFLVLLVTSMAFFVFSFMTLPFILFAPYKFGLLFTCASVSFLAALAFFKGLSALLEHMMNKKRIVFSGALAASMLSTLIFTTIYPLYLLAFISSIVQAVTLASVIVSYVPGGAGALKLMYSSLWEFVKSRTGGGSNMTIPI